MMWGRNSYSSEVREYAERRLREFVLPRADEEWADSRYWPIRLELAWTAIKWIAGGWLGLWIFAACVGWVVRGFAGIPSGKDRRTSSTTE